MRSKTKRALVSDDTEHSSDFRGADLTGGVFRGQELPQRDFRRGVLRNVDFSACDLRGANFADADLTNANFKGATLRDVDFSNANLTKANFYCADLVGAAFIGSNLFKTTFREAKMGQTVFANLDLETCVGLESTQHQAPSSISVECLFRSGNNLPLKFLEGAGFSKNFMAYLPELVQAGGSIQFHSCFLSYSHQDEVFARQLWAAMRDQRIRVWYAPEDMQGGKKLFEQIDRAIHLHDKLLIVVSGQSLRSDWVQTEIRRARKRERKTQVRKLFPIRICDMATLRAWECFDAESGRDIAEEIREYFIPDFSQWTKPGIFEAEFKKLCRDLRQEGVSMKEEEREWTR